MSSGFITESEIEERRRVRQQQWEKVRKPDQPIEAPEEEYDRRTLFERLEEQRKKKEFEYEETHRLKNMVRGLDDDEVKFLEMVDNTKLAEEKKLQAEENEEIRKFRERVAALEEQSSTVKVEEEVKSPVINKPKPIGSIQKKLIGSAIVKKQPQKPSPDSVKNEQGRKDIPSDDVLIGENQSDTPQTPEGRLSVPENSQRVSDEKKNAKDEKEDAQKGRKRVLSSDEESCDSEVSCAYYCAGYYPSACVEGCGNCAYLDSDSSCTSSCSSDDDICLENVCLIPIIDSNNATDDSKKRSHGKNKK